MGPRNHALNGGPDPHEKRQFYGGKGQPAVKYSNICRERCKNGWTNRDAVWDLDPGGPEEAYISRGTHMHNLANTTEPSMCGGDAACCQNTLTTC